MTSGDWSGIPRILRLNIADESFRRRGSAGANVNCYCFRQSAESFSTECLSLSTMLPYQGSRVAAVVMAVVLGWTSHAAATESSAAVASQDAITGTNARVRGLSPRLVAIITEATAQSKTFRGLVDRIGNTDGIVYVAEGQCGHGVGACLVLTMTIAGSNRMLRILVDPRMSGHDLMGFVGHELQHAVEVLSNRGVRSSDAMYLFYKTTCYECSRRFETDAAIRAGNTVRDELRISAAAERRE